MMDKGKQLLELQKKAREIKEKLSNIHIEAEEGGITVVLDGQQEVQLHPETKIDIDFYTSKHEDLKKASEAASKDMGKAIQDALKKSQEIAAKEMQVLMGGMGLPDMEQ